MGNRMMSARESLGNGFISALDDVRHSFEEAAWGRVTTSDLADNFFRWVSDDKQAAPAPAVAEAEVVPAEVPPAQAEPIEGRPSNLEEREAEAAAYARHLDAGPIGTIEIENAHSHEWRNFEEWIDGKDRGEPARDDPAVERDLPEMELGD